jgi:AhpD family alkylhydroperoxidase
MEKTPQETFKAIKLRLSALATAAPSIIGQFGKLSHAASADGLISGRVKELTATAIAVSKGCDDCVAYHVQKAKQLGASKEELIEFIAVAIEMGGGPAVVYGAKALEYFEVA